METKFTKGEWKVERFVNNKGFEISFNDDGEVVADYVHEEADAHLIAAAPEMYEMLARCARELARNGYETETVHELLAKARGE